MKPVRRLRGATPGLSDYMAEEPRGATWEAFRRYRAGAAYRELIDALTGLQHGLCGYCEIGIAAGKRQIEHVVPRREPKRGRAGRLDPGNMIANCLGGTYAGARGSGQYREPVEPNTSCGQKKGGGVMPGFVDPRTLPPAPPLARVGPDVRIAADGEACAAAGRPADKVDETIAFLGLNVERLRMARSQWWRSLDGALRSAYDDEETIRAAAREYLLPRDGVLLRFFTTSRSFFAKRGGEDILAAEPRDWV